MTVLCVGCGQSLPERAARGRPARYHGPACRQRARRTRLDLDPGRAALLAVAERAEHAAIALRRAVTTGQDHDAATAELIATATALADRPNATPPQPNPVTDTAAPPRPSVPEPHPQPAGPAQQPSSSVTKKVTKQAANQHPNQPRRPQPIDPDTVRLQRSTDYDLTGTWQVLAGPTDHPITVGTVRRTGLSKQWEARTPALLTISGGPWHTRQDALIHLVLNHQQAATSPHRTARRPR